MTRVKVPTATGNPIYLIPDCQAPPITLVGCDNGLPGTANSNTQFAPNGAISQGLPVTWLSQAA